MNYKEAKAKISLVFYPPQGKEFRSCANCQDPYIADPGDPEDNVCLWCQIHEVENKCQYCGEPGTIHRMDNMNVIICALCKLARESTYD